MTEDQRPCTCHPGDRPPICQHRYGARDCQDAYRAYAARKVTVSCLCGTQGCIAEVCNPTTFKLAIAAVEIRDLRSALATSSADETTENERTLRRLLAFAYSGPSNLYGDDGELQEHHHPQRFG